jgi:adenine phosphoribosyltransferase
MSTDATSIRVSRAEWEPRWRALIRDVPDFPAPGILFRDITPLLHDVAALHAVNDALADAAEAMGATLIAGIEARGFIFGVPVAERLGVPFVPVRKPGKLPASYASVAYTLEYGNAELQLHRDPSVAGHRVVIIDDLLATGGTAAAAARLVRELGGTPGGCAFVVELIDLEGRAQLPGLEVASLLAY